MTAIDGSVLCDAVVDCVLASAFQILTQSWHVGTDQSFTKSAAWSDAEDARREVLAGERGSEEAMGKVTKSFQANNFTFGRVVKR